MLSCGGDLRWRWPLGKSSPERLHSVTFRREMLLVLSFWNIQAGPTVQGVTPDSNNLQGSSVRDHIHPLAEILKFAALCRSQLITRPDVWALNC